MNKLIQIILVATVFTSCSPNTKNTTTMEEQTPQKNNSTSPADTTPKVTGIGGIFFFSDNPKEMKEWYTKNLGLEVNAWGSSSFDSRDLNDPQKINTLQWTPFKRESDYFSPSKKEFMINYRVQNLEGLLSQLKANGVTVLDSVATYDFGKFVHILDAEGNKIELWEPAEEAPKEEVKK